MDNAHKSKIPSGSLEEHDIPQLPFSHDATSEPENDPLHFRLQAPATSLPYRVRTIGHIQDNPNHTTLGTYFDDAMLMIFLAGQGTYHLNNETLQLHRGLVGIILPGQDPGLVVADPDDPYEHLLCRFAGHEALKTARRIVQEQGNERFFKFSRWNEAAEVLGRGIAYWPGREGVRPGHGDRLRRVDAILAETLTLLDTPVVSTQHQQLSAQAMWEYMHVYISRPINLDQAAQDFGVSKQYLCKIAKQQLGQSMGETWTTMKMNWAMALLQHDEIGIAQIAVKVGYQDPLYFSRVFRTRLGVSPRQWRTMHKNSR